MVAREKGCFSGEGSTGQRSGAGPEARPGLRIRAAQDKMRGRGQGQGYQAWVQRGQDQLQAVCAFHAGES